MRTVTPAWVAAALAILYFTLGFHPIWDIDIFWHVEAGRWICDQCSLPSTDIFSAVDSARGWFTFQWLYEILVYGVDGAAGLMGVRALHALPVALAVGFFAHWNGRRCGIVAGILAAAVLMVLFADRLRVRPDAFNLLFMVLFWPLLVAPTWSRWQVVSLALLVSLWANMHAGGALLAPVLLGARVAGRGADELLAEGGARWLRGWVAVKRDLAIWLVCVSLMCLMPGFLRGTYQAFFMLGPSEEFIPEWMTTFEFLAEHAGSVHEWVAGLLPLLLLGGFLAAMGLALRRGRRSGQLFLLALALPLVALSLRHVRFLWLGAFVVPLWFGFLDCGKQRGQAVRGWRLSVMLMVAVSLVALDGHYHVVRNGGGLKSWIDGLGQDVEAGEFPVGAADFLAQSSFSGRILNHAPWGGYLLYRLGREVTVYTDGRGNFGPVETQLLATWDAPSRRHDAIARAFAAAPFEAVVHPDPFPLKLASCREWIQVYHDATARVFLRATGENVRNLKSMGAWLPAGTGWSAADSCGLHRAFTEASAARRLAGGEQWWRRVRLQALTDGGDEGARLALAALYFDLGAYLESRSLLAPMVEVKGGGNLNAAFLDGFAALAMGAEAEGLERLREVARGAGEGELNPGAAAILTAIFRRSSAP